MQKPGKSLYENEYQPHCSSDITVIQLKTRNTVFRLKVFDVQNLVSVEYKQNIYSYKKNANNIKMVIKDTAK